MKKTLKLIVLLQLLVILSFGIIYKLQAVQGEAKCLGNCLPETGVEHNIGECWRRLEGPDENNGFIIDCQSVGGYCQETFCRTASDCYINWGNNNPCGGW